MRTPLTDAEIAAALRALPGWSHEERALSKTYRFGTFRDALAFIVRLGFEAEDLDHHPEIANVYNRVGLTLRTHDAGNTVTALDVELARRAERIAGG
jgi:4a-hydroxytetrahydrobiopterin dehydratase